MAHEAETRHMVSSKIDADLNEEQIQMLTIIGSSSGGAYRKKLIPSEGDDKIRAEHNLDELLKWMYINSYYSQDAEDSLYTTTPAGRALLVKNKGHKST